MIEITREVELLTKSIQDIYHYLCILLARKSWQTTIFGVV